MIIMEIPLGAVLGIWLIFAAAVLAGTVSIIISLDGKMNLPYQPQSGAKYRDFNGKVVKVLDIIQRKVRKGEFEECVFYQECDTWQCHTGRVQVFCNQYISCEAPEHELKAWLELKSRTEPSF